MLRYYSHYHSEDTIFWISQILNSKDGVDFAMLFTLWSSLSASVFAEATPRQVRLRSSSYDETRRPNRFGLRFQLRPNRLGKPEDFRSCVVKGSR
jgi:hypothetical protein